MSIDHERALSAAEHQRLQEAARDHLWLHFSRHSVYEGGEMPVIVRGEGAYIFDAQGRRYLDGLAGLFVNQLGHGRTELAEAAAKQAAELAFHPLWSYAHPGAIHLAEKVANYAPGDLNRVFFTTGGGEAVETAWKLAKQYFKLTGKPHKHKVISRAIAYHGTPQGALSITGIPGMKAPFEPLVPSTFRVPNTNFYRAPYFEDDEKAFGLWAANEIATAIENEGPETVAAVFLEPVQNSGGCFPPPPGYFERVREICDEYDVLMVSDEVICAFGRLGYMFGAERYGYQPDMITCAKGITSGYSPLGAMIASDRLMEPFLEGHNAFLHGYTFGGHPVSTAVALKNLEIFETEGINEHVRASEGDFRLTLEKLKDLDIVGDVRGDGYFYGIELVKDKKTKETFNEAESERLLRGFLSRALYDAAMKAERASGAV
ncbi:MAG TPA: aspartate aminotransferase family protein, partial [Marmoricola sp.]|nr:aspartate aminotransferase family protein [Marmoricola sp.]